MNKIAAEDLTQDIFNLKKVKVVDNSCSKSHDDIEYDCKTGAIFDLEKRKMIGYCDCYYDRIRSNYLKQVLSIFPSIITNKLKSHKKLKHQRNAIEKLIPEKNGKYFSRPTKGALLIGSSQIGKTHIICKFIETMILSMDKMPKVTFKRAQEMIDIWQDKYGENKGKAKHDLNEILKSDIVFLDNFDKIENITPARELEIFQMLEMFLDKGILLYMTANKSIEDFLSSYPSYKNRDLSIFNRIKILCEVINVRDIKQEELFDASKGK